jgi:hypothetical protein
MRRPKINLKNPEKKIKANANMILKQRLNQVNSWCFLCSWMIFTNEKNKTPNESKTTKSFQHE